MRGLTVDLNADLGEGDPHDAEIIRLISSVNIACGGHAGDVATMTETCRIALHHGVTIGAHVSYVDRAGFGRSPVEVDPDTLTAQLIEQITALQSCLDHLDLGELVAYVKPHGALYNRIVDDAAHAEAVVAAAEHAGRLPLVGLGHGRAVDLAGHRGLTTVAEAFADRAYTTNAAAQPVLMARTVTGAVLHDPQAVARRAVAMVRDQSVDTAAGPVRVDIDTLCLHGDTPGAVAIATTVRSTLGEAGVTIVPAVPRRRR